MLWIWRNRWKRGNLKDLGAGRFGQTISFRRPTSANNEASTSEEGTLRQPVAPSDGHPASERHSRRLRAASPNRSPPSHLDLDERLFYSVSSPLASKQAPSGRTSRMTHGPHWPNSRPIVENLSAAPIGSHPSPDRVLCQSPAPPITPACRSNLPHQHGNATIWFRTRSWPRRIDGSAMTVGSLETRAQTTNVFWNRLPYRTCPRVTD